MIKIKQKNQKKIKKILTELYTEGKHIVRVKGKVELWKPYDRELSPTIELKEKHQLEAIFPY